jgi:hypothetical protein
MVDITPLRKWTHGGCAAPINEPLRRGLAGAADLVILK